MAETVTNKGKYLLSTVGINNLTVRACIFTGTATGTNNPDLDTVADLDAVSGVSIHSERLTPGSITVTEDDANDRANIDCANLTFAAAPGVTAQGLAFYHEVSAADASRQLISIHTTGFPQPMDGGLTVTVADFLRLS
jgi:hypothetical protein